MLRQFWYSTRLTRSTYIVNLLLHRTNCSLSNLNTFNSFFSLSTFNKPFYLFNTRNMSNEVKTTTHKFTNRLIQEKSPYLLQHAHNPVDWYPWSQEAFDKARQEDKLIFLSVGYSTCHWCHVMERESFENETVAAYMNQHFINIKVDREERPDVDKIYMQFVLMINGHGGWPMSVWLTPDLAPITGGTYFPPTDRWGTPSFINVLKSINKKWEENRQSLKSTGVNIISALQNAINKVESSETECLQSVLQNSLLSFKRRFDNEYGGFGSHPKFPEVSRLNYLFHAYKITGVEETLLMAITTLDHIGKGGIYDHISGGFARYSVDRQWHVPHFEKMLYDQGQLMTAYANAYKITKELKFFELGDSTYRYLINDLQHPLGGFYAGEDADSLPNSEDSVKVEGAFYAWTYLEVKDVITKSTEQFVLPSTKVFELYAYHYNLKPEGNVQPASDPHGHLTGKNILIVRGSEQETSEKFGISCEDVRSLLSSVNAILKTVRSERPRPHLDTKIICSWNGLVLTGLAKLANCYTPKRNEYLKTASQLVKFMQQHLYDAEHCTLLRSAYGVSTDNESLQTAIEQVEGFLDDYAFVIQGLLNYYTATFDYAALEWAKLLQARQDELFWDNENGGYFYSKSHMPNIVLRLKEDHDGAEPCGNSVAAQNLLHLSHICDDESYRAKAKKLFDFFSSTESFGYTLPEMMSAWLRYELGVDFVAVVGNDSEALQQILQICRKTYLPSMVLIHIDPSVPMSAQQTHRKFEMVNGKPTVYICRNNVCNLPITDVEKLEQELGSCARKIF